ncbi:MAG TPA: hypothetical protein VF192_11725 [Longimicrobiales bacterium]
MPIGFVSGDGLAHSATFTRGTWTWNPNHLLLEPVGSWWQAVTAGLGSARPAPDRLKWLSIVCGAAALGIFRWRVAGPLAPGRLEANLATAWVALGSAFSRLWISDEIHMLQMPFLAGVAALVVAYVARPSWMLAVFAGLVGGAAALAYISNILIPLAIAGVIGMRYALRREVRRVVQIAAGLGLGAVLTALAGLIAAWAVVGPSEVGPVSWITSYGGDASPGLLAAGYGADLSVRAITVSTARAVYGSLSSIVDLAPVVEAIRDGRTLTPASLAPLAFCLAGVLVLVLALRDSLVAPDPDAPGTRGIAPLLAAGIGIAVFTFAVYWNNSDDQFYFQLGIAMGALLTGIRLRGRRLAAILALVLLTLGWNALDMVKNRVLYPRAERVALLEHALAGADLVIYPGYDEVDQLLFFVDGPDRTRRLSVTSLADRYPAPEGLDTLAARIRQALEGGGRVDIVSIYDVPPKQNPWKALAAAGYGPDRVIAALAAFPVEPSSRSVGTFTIRSIAARSPRR